MKTFIVLSVLVVLGKSEFPKNFKKCNRKDANFKECILEAAQDGLSQLTKPFPKYGIPSTSPLEFTELRIKGQNTGVVTLDQNYKDCKGYGIATTKVTKFEFNFDNHTAFLQGIIPSLEMHCTYEIDGKVLLLTVKGTGPNSIILENATITLSLKWVETKKNNKTFIKFVSNKLTMDPENLILRFENLFNGDKTIGDNINKVVNENWKNVYADVREVYEKAFGDLMQKISNDFFSKVTMEDAFD